LTIVGTLDSGPSCQRNDHARAADCGGGLGGGPGGNVEPHS